MKPYYSDGLVTLFHGDCLDVLPTLDRFDLIFTSPPYNLSGDGRLRMSSGGSKWTGAALARGYDDHDDAMPWPEYVRWQQRVLNACWARLSPAGAIFYNHKPRVADGEVRLPLALNPGLPLRQVVIWARAGGVNFTTTHYVPTHEWLMVLAPAEFRLRDQSASGVGDVWYVPQEANPDHPAPFPIGLPARAIETTAPGTVLDPFSGSGTTLRAAKDAGVRAVGIEKSERYCEVAARRLSQESLFGASA